MTDYELEIVLVVGGGRLPRPLDLDVLQENLDGEFNKHGDQPGLYFRFEEDGPLTTFYEGDETGAPYIVRAGDREKLEAHNQRTLDALVDIGVMSEEESEEMDLEFHNFVANGNLNKQLKLSTLTLALRTFDENQQPKNKVEYEPEQFPPIVYYGHDSPCVSLVFRNGKVIIPGGKSLDECADTLRNLVHELADRFPSRFDEPGEITFTNG